MGAVFCVTAFAYGFMAFQAVNAVGGSADRHVTHPLFTWLSNYGTTAILGELAVLAVLTVGAIGTDRWWTEENAKIGEIKQDESVQESERRIERG